MHHHSDILALRQRGARLTPQRLITLEVIKRGKGHLTAEEIHREVQRHYPYVSLATVYRTLQWLQEHGLVSEIALGSDRKYYEYAGGERHHHLICQRCGSESEIDDSVLVSLKEQILLRYGFEAQLDHLAIGGLCQQCRTEP